MSNTLKRIALNERGENSGPDYQVFSSLDCQTYTLIGNVNLPQVGSEASVIVPQNTLCLKLVNINSTCDNEVIKVIGTTTTTTTTSIEGPIE
jgi:hypothetical protein